MPLKDGVFLPRFSSNVPLTGILVEWSMHRDQSRS